MDEKTLTAEEEMNRLLQSRLIREVYSRRVAPRTLDKQVNDLRKECKELKELRKYDRAEIIRLRRQIEALEMELEERRKENE